MPVGTIGLRVSGKVSLEDNSDVLVPTINGAAVYIGPAITFALVDIILPLALAFEIGHRAAGEGGTATAGA